MSENEKIPMVLDLSKLSPMSRLKICNAVSKIAWSDAQSINESISSYSDGSVKNEMLGWAFALGELYSTANKIGRQ